MRETHTVDDAINPGKGKALPKSQPWRPSAGAARKRVGNVRMQILVSESVRRLIEKQAKRKNKTLSHLVARYGQ